MSNLFVIFGSFFIIAVSVVNGQNASAFEKNLLVMEPKSKTEDLQICFSVGCFKLSEPWYSKSRPVETPLSPEKINTKFHFYTRRNRMNPETVTFSKEMDLSNVKFEGDRLTAVLVPSFSNGNTTWLFKMKKAYLDKVDGNVIIVDWSGGYSAMNYLKAVSNARVVGKVMALLFKKLQKKFGVYYHKFHLICHGLGAHVCSYSGKETRQLGRLTALDPAQPLFEGFPPKVRLHKTDAEFVDVIHTNTKPLQPRFGFGMRKAYGHVDFYINGGFDQPGCTPPLPEHFFKPVLKNFYKYPLDLVGYWLHCDHIRAPYYFIDAIKEEGGCIMKGIASDDKISLDSKGFIGKIKPQTEECRDDNCITMGLDTEKSYLKGIFVVKTNSKSPFCVKMDTKHKGFFQKVGRFLSVLFG